MTSKYPPIRFSNLKQMAKSAHHYKFHAARPYEPQTTKRHLLIGTAVHKMVLGAGRDVIVYDGKRDKRIAAFKEILAAHPQGILLNPGEYEQAKRIAYQALDTPRVAELLARAPNREVELTWQVNGKNAAGTLDAYGDDILIEVKTGQDMSLDKFYWEAVRKYLYVSQLSWYRNGLESTDLVTLPRREVFIIGIENSLEAPPPVVRPVTERALADGERTWRAWMEQLSVYIDSNYYPGYSEADAPIDAQEDFAGDDPAVESDEEDDEDGEPDLDS